MMDRREFVVTGMSGALGSSAVRKRPPTSPSVRANQADVRAAFPRLARETFVNAAAGTPLGAFAERGLQRYMEFQRLGGAGGRSEYVGEMRSNVRRVFAELIGADASEIALVHCTKAGEQIVLDGLEPMRHGTNVVTNDMHFSGSLHNLVGLKRAGMDVRIVEGKEWDVALDAMDAAIDDRTALVAVTLVSNINGRIEPLRRLAEIAHARGAYVFADVIQAAGIVPFNVRDLGIDFAACNGYKWLFGVHGSGFLYVRKELQGAGLPDRLFPGHVQYNYVPWIDDPDPRHDAFVYTKPRDASRYEPGHVSYLGYCSVYEGLRFIHRIGPQAVFEHSLRLSRRVKEELDPDRYDCISPHWDRCPIVTFLTREGEALERRLRAANVVVTLAGNRIRISPAVYNHDGDIDHLVDVLNADG